MINQFSFVVPGKDGRAIIADATFDADFNNLGLPLPVVLFVHGFKGFKDWGHFNLMAKEFAKKGIVFIKFNFSHNGGTVENPIDFSDLKAFSQNDFLKELNDLNQLLLALNGGLQVEKNQNKFENLLKILDVSKLSIVAHSRGGGIASVFASEQPQVSKLVLWNAVSDFYKRLPVGKEMIKWKEKGVVYIPNSRTNQQMPMLYSFVEVMNENRFRLDIQNSCEQLKIPSLIVQAENDAVVLKGEGACFKNWIKNSRYLLVPKSDHVFGSKHPFLQNTFPGDTSFVISETIDFLKS